MPKLRALTSGQILRILIEFGFEVIRTRGSHATLRRRSGGVRESLTVPLHRDLPAGTIAAIYRQARKFIPEKELRPRFYADD